MPLTNTAANQLANLVGLTPAQIQNILLYGAPYVGTFASLPAASSVAVGTKAWITEFGGMMLTATATHWRPMAGVMRAYCQAADITTTANASEQIFAAAQVAFPAAFLQIGCKLRVFCTHNKSAASENSTARVRLGSNGSTGDPIVTSTPALSGTGRSFGWQFELLIASATATRMLGRNASDIPYVGGGAVAEAAAVTIPNISGALTLSMTQQVSVGSETITLRGYSLEVIFPG